MTLEQLYYFIAASQKGSINAASRELHISPQALSRTLIHLETELGTTLFERSRHGVTLTPQGRRLLNAAVQFTDSLSHLNDTSNSDIFLFDNPCSILSSPGLGYFFPTFLANLYTAVPDLQVNIRYNSYLHILDEVEQRSVEIALTNIGTLDGQSIYPSLYDDLLFYPLFTYYYYCTASVHSPLATYKTVSCKTLLAYPLICIGESLEQSAMSFIRKIGTPRKIIWESNFRLAHCMAAAGHGYLLGYAPEKSPLPPPQSRDLINILLKESILSTFGYVLKKDAPLSRHTQELIRFLNGAVSSQADIKPIKI